jgi:hypothetical protein
MENAIKRHQRLEGDDHFLSTERPQAKNNINADSLMNFKEDKLVRLSSLKLFISELT